jgi:hypothetical protein
MTLANARNDLATRSGRLAYGRHATMLPSRHAPEPPI